MNIYMKNRKILLLVLLTIALTLSGCFNFSGSTTQKPTADTNSRIIDYPEFTITIPREWDVIESKNFTSEVPPETAIVVRNNVKNDTFTANVNVVKRGLQGTMESLEYAKEVINRQKTGLYNYKENKQELTKIQIGDKSFDTYLERFEGKKDASSDLVDFIQIYGVKGNLGYIVTGAYSPQETGSNISTVEGIVKSFLLK